MIVVQVAGPLPLVPLGNLAMVEKGARSRRAMWRGAAADSATPQPAGSAADRLCGNASKPAVGAAETGPVFSGQTQKTPALFQVLDHKSQTEIRVAKHGYVRSGLVGRTSTRSGLTPLGH